MKLYAVIGTITPGCGVYIHLYGLHTDRKAAERRRAEVEAAARRANEGEIEDVAPRLVKVVEADGDAAVDIFLGGYVECDLLGALPVLRRTGPARLRRHGGWDMLRHQPQAGRLLHPADRLGRAQRRGGHHRPLLEPTVRRGEHA